MEADFSGYATKAGIRCSDGVTILAHAFKHQHLMQVPLVWQHGHDDPTNLLGHAILENRDDGVYAYGFFNDSDKARHAKVALEHKDINMMSIWANQLMKRDSNVVHGTIREVSLVISGANPGAVIESVTIRHSDGDVTTLPDEAIITTGLELEHESLPDGEPAKENKKEETVTHADGKDDKDSKPESDDDNDDETVDDVFETLTDKQKEVVHFMLGEAVAAAKSEITQDNLGQDAGNTNDTQEGTEVTHNVFEHGSNSKDKDSNRRYLTQEEAEGIMHDAMKCGSLKDAVQQFVISHAIDNIDVLFPEARTLGNTPELNKRRTEWVSDVLGAATKSPFARVKTFSADLTEDEARARGYIKGNLKKEEFFSVARRITTPTTIYKKQKLDRDDIVDIVDFDVVAWLRGEMRLMLDEELARAILIGDGRDIASEDKINQQNIRPIASDHALYVTTVNVNIDDANSSVTEVVDAIVENRKEYKGTGLPTMFTTETYLAKFMLLKDTVGRRIYKNLDELASELRVAKIVPVEVMEDEPDIVCILVNMQDYTIGADRGGNVSMFDDFDIDYNQYKYLIETRVSGALTKLKCAIVVRKVASNAQLVDPATPSYDDTTGVITINATTGVTYKRSDTDATVTGTLAAIPVGSSLEIYAVTNSGYYMSSDADERWTFRRRS